MGSAWGPGRGGVSLGLEGEWGRVAISLGSQGWGRSARNHRHGQSQPGVPGMGQNQVVTEGRELSRFLEVGQDGVTRR